MTISIWRYSHLALAVSSFLFLALASVTGIVLAFEPISQKVQSFQTSGFDEITLSEALPVFKKSFSEITEIKVDDNNFVIVNAIDDSGDDVEVYIDAKTGKTLGKVAKQSEFFKWFTALHRSLFIHETGRFLVGLASFLLLLIALSGTVLIVRRQRGLKRFFTKIVKENFAQYYHVVTGRLSLIPILIIAISGTYLSLARFEIFKEQKISHKIDYDNIKSEPKKEIADFKIFQNIKLATLQSIEFPFSDDVEDYFTVKLDEREIVVNQFTGEILSEIKYDKTAQITAWSLLLHTGRGSAIWAVILAIASANILFFIYSGFAITLKRLSNRIKNKFSAKESSFIILVGSENGSTFRYANAINKQLIKNGQKSFIAEMNSFQSYPNAKHFIILTATYGLGDAPVNADKFISLLRKNHPQQNVNFSVVGFGSKSYPDFCKFAFEVNNALSEQTWAIPLLEIHTINDKSPQDFSQWATLWFQKAEMSITILNDLLLEKPKLLQQFTVTEKTKIAHEDGAFLIRLKPKSKVTFTSGDLLSIVPANDHRQRQYSIGKIGSEIQLSVKLHVNGLGSEFLYRLNVGDNLNAAIDRNTNFHFPKKAKSVIMISNGTGIAPFLGMIDHNEKAGIHLYCGFRGQSSFDLYQDKLNSYLKLKKISKLKVAFSREGEKHYVKDMLAKDAGLLAESLRNKGVIMICGSLAMQKNVTELLEEICLQNNQQSLSYYQSRNQVLMDCY